MYPASSISLCVSTTRLRNTCCMTAKQVLFVCLTRPKGPVTTVLLLHTLFSLTSYLPTPKHLINQYIHPTTSRPIDRPIRIMPSQNRGSSSNQRSASTRGSTSGGWQTSLSQRLASTGLSTTTQSSSSSQLSSSTPQPSSSRTSANQASSAINTQQHTAAGSVSQRGSTSDDDVRTDVFSISPFADSRRSQGDSNSSTPPEDEVTDDEVTYQLVCWNSAADVLVESYTASQPDSTGETTQDLEVVGQLSDRVRGRTSRMRFRTNEELRAYIRDEINQPSLAPWVPTREEMQARIARAL